MVHWYRLLELSALFENKKMQAKIMSDFFRDLNIWFSSHLMSVYDIVSQLGFPEPLSSAKGLGEIGNCNSDFIYFHIWNIIYCTQHILGYCNITLQTISYLTYYFVKKYGNHWEEWTDIFENLTKYLFAANPYY